ncbi:MAG: nucleotidyl transferase AbiEii/AbiGii toxin family protein [Candidatus Thiodiazotropha sp. (ex Troendleina suluensis)]|nr:nucleotidyl transferase AbiEii/AbiGii toxin family protein [Candidatus Thiodiazotropha sp. (ex Troendleina suluensis)]
MSNSLLDLSGKIDPLLLEVFNAIAEVAAARGVPCFVVGATARDMILSHGHGIASKRATVDIDLGIEVAEWDEFSALKDELIATGQFEPTQAAQRLLYRRALPIDIVPFGPLEHANKEITWPPDHSVRMNVLGFEDAFRSAQVVRFRSDPVLDILFATPAGLAVLKVIAWSDRTPQGNKDAGDLDFLMRSYMDAGNQERLAEEHADLLAVDDFDYERTGVRLLGWDMAKVMSPETRIAVLEILEQETGDRERYRLVEDMIDNYAMTGDAFGECLQYLETLKAGIQEGKK